MNVRFWIYKNDLQPSLSDMAIYLFPVEYISKYLAWVQAEHGLRLHHWKPRNIQMVQDKE